MVYINGIRQLLLCKVFFLFVGSFSDQNHSGVYIKPFKHRIVGLQKTASKTRNKIPVIIGKKRFEHNYFTLITRNVIQNVFYHLFFLIPEKQWIPNAMLHFSAGTRDILHSVSEDSDPLHTASDISYPGNCDRLMKFLRYSLAWVLVIKKIQ